MVRTVFLLNLFIASVRHTFFSEEGFVYSGQWRQPLFLIYVDTVLTIYLYAYERLSL